MKLAAVLLVIAVSALTVASVVVRPDPADQPAVIASKGEAGESSDGSRTDINPVGGAAHGVVHVNRPAGPPTVLTDVLDAAGNPIAVSCGSCHSVREPNREITRGDQLTNFHTGLTTSHGGVACLSCHNAQDYDTLKLASGQAVPYRNVMQLCGQCHGPQLRDYAHGSHGGMTGHWDLSRGDRQRNNCIDCHDVHAPAFSVMKPVFPPMPTGKGEAHE